MDMTRIREIKYDKKIENKNFYINNKIIKTHERLIHKISLHDEKFSYFTFSFKRFVE
jgi:hypothetical protein